MATAQLSLSQRLLAHSLAHSLSLSLSFFLSFSLARWLACLLACLLAHVCSRVCANMTTSIQNLPGSPVLHFLSIPGTACYRKLVLALSARRELLFMFGSRRSYQIWTYISDSETFCFLTLHKTSCIVLCMSTLLYFLNQAQLLPNCMYFLVEAEDKHQESIKLSNVVLGCFRIYHGANNRLLQLQSAMVHSSGALGRKRPGLPCGEALRTHGSLAVGTVEGCILLVMLQCHGIPENLSDFDWRFELHEEVKLFSRPLFRGAAKTYGCQVRRRRCPHGALSAVHRRRDPDFGDDP